MSVGDTVSKDDTLLVLESDKASMEIPAEDAGEIKEILVSPGDSLETGALLMKVGVKTFSSETSLEEESGVAKQEVHQENFETTKQEPVQEKPRSSVGGLFASPGVRRLARELEIELSVIKGTGRKGRISKQDLHSYIKLRMSSGSTISHPKKEIDFSKWLSLIHI